MTLEEIENRAQELAHANSSVCRNNWIVMHGKHNKSCRKLALLLYVAMVEIKNNYESDNRRSG